MILFNLLIQLQIQYNNSGRTTKLPQIAPKTLARNSFEKNVTNKRKPINFVANKSLFDDRSEKGSVHGKRANVGVVVSS
jgi:hypothetical protein